VGSKKGLEDFVDWTGVITKIEHAEDKQKAFLKLH